MLHEMYHGRGKYAMAASEAATFASLMFEKAQSQSKSKAPLTALTFDQFVQVIGVHPLSKKFFSLDELSFVE